MLNKIETYTETGTKAAEARQQEDLARYNFHYNWMRRAVKLEKNDDKQVAQNAFNEAYKEEMGLYDSVR